jgi:hypothetical protein
MAETNPIQMVVKGGAYIGRLIVGSFQTEGFAPIHGLFLLTATLSPAAVAADTVAGQALTVAGIAAGDVILAVVKPTEQAGLAAVSARVTAANTVELSFVNATVASITPTAAETYTFAVLRP